MRKAFDANVPKLKPRLRPGAAPSAPVETAEAAEAEVVQIAAPEPVQTALPTSSPAAIAAPAPAALPAPVPTPAATPPAARSPAPAPAARVAAAEPVSDVGSRKDRLDKIKRKVAEAARPAVRPAPIPTDPARAAESVLGLVRDLEAELGRAREREEALRADLDDSRKELARTASDGRAAAERLGVAETELEEKRGVLAELLGEMQALEDERDESVRRAQALASLDEERARLLEEVTRRAEEEARLRAEREAEVERLSEELRSGAQDGARLRAAVGELARERDQLAHDLERAREERDELASAKRALEQVHAALAQARARLG
jgi:hypothetical protein